MAQRHGTVRAEVSGHGQFETSAHTLDLLIEEHWGTPVEKLFREIKERQGDPEYDTYGLTKIEAILILAELEGMGTN